MWVGFNLYTQSGVLKLSFLLFYFWSKGLRSILLHNVSLLSGLGNGEKRGGGGGGRGGSICMYGRGGGEISV